MTCEVSVVVVAYHRPIADLLARLAHPAVETVVVNVEDDPDVAAAVRHAGVVEVPLAENVGFAGGVNRGVAVSTAPVVVFANDDLELSAADALAACRALDELGADVVVPSLASVEGHPEPMIAALPTPWTLLVEWALTPDARPRWAGRVQVEKWRRPTHPERVASATAAVVSTRRSLLVDRPLPEAYHLYWEEAEWFHLLRRDGAVVFMDPRIVVRHRGGRGDVRADKSRLLARNAVRCVRRTQGRGRALAAWPVVVLWNLRLWVVAMLRRDRQLVAARRAGLVAALAAWREIS